MNEKQELIDKWEQIKMLVKTEHEIRDVPYETWIVPMKIFSVKNELIRVLVPAEDPTGVNYISNKYRLPFKVAISEIMNRRYEIEFISEKDAQKDFQEESAAPLQDKNSERIQKSNLNPKYTFDTFVVGPNNRLAHSAALAVSEDPGAVYNPLFLYGGPELGKTHLMHSIGHYIIQKNSNKIIRYVTSETFMNEVIESIKSGSQAMSKFREKYRTVDVLLLDDIQIIIGKESTQNEFFNTLDIEPGHQVPRIYRADMQTILQRGDFYAES